MRRRVASESGMSPALAWRAQRGRRSAEGAVQRGRWPLARSYENMLTGREAISASEVILNSTSTPASCVRISPRTSRRRWNLASFRCLFPRMAT